MRALLAPDWPYLTLRGPEVPQVAPTNYPASFRPVWATKGQSGSVETTLNQNSYEFAYFRANFVLQISHLPKIAQK